MSETEQQFLYRIDVRVDEIGERVSKIEGRMDDKSPKGFRKTLSEYGGLIALILSITIGDFTLYDNFLLQPSKERIQAKVNFRNDINELASINARIAGLDWDKTQAAIAQAQVWTPQRMVLLDKLKISDKAMPDVLKFGDRLLLVNEYEFFGRMQEALEQVELAHQSSTDAIQRANAYWAKARLNGKLNKLAAMREIYMSTLNEFKSLGLKNVAGSVMQVYMQWVASELVNGTCDTAYDAYSRMVDDFNLPDVWPSTKKDIGKQFAMMLSQSPRTCDLDLKRIT